MKITLSIHPLILNPSIPKDTILRTKFLQYRG